MQSLVSVIIPTKNTAFTLETCLQSIENQTYKYIEIIVIDNNSTDKTVSIAKQFTKSVFTKGNERSAQRNFGATKSRGEYLIFVDADMYLSPEVIRECVQKIQKHVGLYIPERILGTGIWGQVRDFERQFYTGTVIDAIRFVPRQIFDTVKGFDENLTAGEDWDFDKRIRKLGSTQIIKSALFHDERNKSLTDYLSKKTSYSKPLQAYISKWPNDTEVAKQLGFGYRFIGVFTEHGKWKQLLKHPILTILMFLQRIAVGVSYFVTR
ncbi:MAG: glycosyltransferase family 2 protein [Weeksellaceae bacterium]